MKSLPRGLFTMMKLVDLKVLESDLDGLRRLGMATVCHELDHGYTGGTVATKVVVFSGILTLVTEHQHALQRIEKLERDVEELRRRPVGWPVSVYGPTL